MTAVDVTIVKFWCLPTVCKLAASGAKGVHRLCWLCALLAALLVAPSVAEAHDAVPHNSGIMDLVKFDQRLDEELPVELTLRDESGKAVELGQYFNGKPVILALSYFECATLCPLVRHGLVEALRPLAFTAGDEFQVLLVSIDPDESTANAMAVKQTTLEEYGRANSEAGWHFLTSDHATIDQLADAIGFRYAYDGEQDEYAHPSGVVLLTPGGTISRYFFGIEYSPQDLRLGLVEASQNRIGGAIDQLLLLCYHYDPTLGKYNLLIMNVVRMAGVLMVAVLGGLIFVMWRKEATRTARIS